MKQNRKRLNKPAGWILFICALGLFCVQIGYLFVNAKYQAEYIDDRLFYIINIACALCLALAIWFLLEINKAVKLVTLCVIILFIISSGGLLVKSNQEVNHITSLSPDWKHVLSIKENVESGDAIYYRSYYGILARPKERLHNQIDGEVKVEWLANDIAVLTYKIENQTVQQFIATYGDRGGGLAYYYVGAEIHGRWQFDDIEVESNTEGITVTENGTTDSFQWDDIVQFGTLAVVLMKNNEAAWTLSLNEDFDVHSAANTAPTGTISLYKATLEKNKPYTLTYRLHNEGSD